MYKTKVLSLKSRSVGVEGKVFYDFCVNGRSLWEQCGLDSRTRIGFLGWLNKNYEKELLKQLLNIEQNPYLEEGRKILFVCPECGDISCGVTSVHVEETENEIIWSEFGDEVDYEEGYDCSDYNKVGIYVFDKTAYKETLSGYLNTL